MIWRGYKTELVLNNHQKTDCLRYSDAARWVYNWGLEQKIKAYQAKKKTPSMVDLHGRLVILKRKLIEDGGVPWLYEISKCVPQQALRHLDKAYSGFFRRCKTKVRKKGFPRFKKKKGCIVSFTLEGAVSITDSFIRLPKLGMLKLKEKNYLPVGVKVISATVSETAGRWFVSVLVEESKSLLTGKETLGVDVGIKSLAVLSDGTVFENPRSFKRNEKRLRLLRKSVSRKKKGSQNRKKAVAKLARLHYRIACVRKDSIHKATTAITKRVKVLGVETLNIAGMMKNHRLAKSLADASMGEFHRQLEYKMNWRDGMIVKADRFYPSSKTCSACGLVKEVLKLSEREYVCTVCGLVVDRDLNAAINLRNLAASSAVTACCPGSSGRYSRPAMISKPVKLLVGQEPNTI